MKNLFFLSVLIMLVSCNKNSNELKPILAEPLVYKLTATINGEDYLRCIAQVAKSSKLDTTNIRLEVLNDSMANKIDSVEAYIVFQLGSGRLPDSVKAMKLVIDITTKGVKKQDVANLFGCVNKKIALTKLPSKLSNGLFKYSGYYSLGNYKAYSNGDSIVGICKALIAADGDYSLWLNDSKNKQQKITGKLNESNNTCYGCKLAKYGDTDTYDVQLKTDSSGNYFTMLGNSVNFQLSSSATDSPIDSIAISLIK